MCQQKIARTQPVSAKKKIKKRALVPNEGDIKNLFELFKKIKIINYGRVY
jgi:hypothetical protein